MGYPRYDKNDIIRLMKETFGNKIPDYEAIKNASRKGLCPSPSTVIKHFGSIKEMQKMFLKETGLDKQQPLFN